MATGQELELKSCGECDASTPSLSLWLELLLTLQSRCAELRRLLEEERKLVQRLKQEREDKAQMGKRKIGRLRQRFAEVQKDAEYATAQADVAERECAEVKSLLEEQKKLVQRLIREKGDEVQLAKRQIEELDQELAHARKDAELAQKDADAAENEWIKVKRDLKSTEEHVKMLQLQCHEKSLQIANSLNASVIAENKRIKVKRDLKNMEGQVKLLKLTNALQASVIAERECANLKRRLIEEGTAVQRLIIEKDDVAEQAKREIEKMKRELASAQKEAQYAQKDADIAENEWNKVKKEVKEKEEIIKLLKLDIQEIRQVNRRRVEEISQELEDARNDAAIAQNECIKAKEDLQEKLELIQMLELECQETKERAVRQVEEKELELADALNAVTSASSSSSIAQDCVICLTNEKDMAFGCGHMTCEECGRMLSTCPICRENITNRIKLFTG